MLQNIAPDIWLRKGPVIKAAAGFHYPTQMVVIRLPGIGLWVWSPIALSDDVKQALAPLGPVAHLIAPNTLHHMAMQDWQSAYPEAACHGARGLARKRPDVAWNSMLGPQAHTGWQEVIDQVHLPNRIAPETVFFHRPSRTALVTDIIQHLPKGFYSGWRGSIARLDLMTAPQPEVPRKFRLALGRRDATRQAVRDILDWRAENLIFAHGPPVLGSGHEALTHAFRWLTD